MSILSAVVGSSPATLHNARAEVSNRYGNGILSNSEEKKFVFERLAKDIPKMIGTENAKHWPPGAAIGYVVDAYTQTGKSEDVKFTQIFNRVMVNYYDFDLKNGQETLAPALVRMSFDLNRYITSNGKNY